MNIHEFRNTLIRVSYAICRRTNTRAEVYVLRKCVITFLAFTHIITLKCKRFRDVISKVKKRRL